MIDRAEFQGERQPKLKPADLGRADTAVLRVSRAQVIDANDPESASGTRKAVVLEFSEFPGQAYWPNRVSTITMIDLLGEEESDWIGKRVPLVKARTKNPKTKKTVEVLWIADKESWPEIMRAYGKRAAGKRAAKKTAKKRR